jgi:hypothetical protein
MEKIFNKSFNEIFLSSLRDNNLINLAMACCHNDSKRQKELTSQFYNWLEVRVTEKISDPIKRQEVIKFVMNKLEEEIKTQEIVKLLS